MSARDPVPPGKAPSRPQEKPKLGAAQDRLAAALRENLKRRKAQERARKAPETETERQKPAQSPPSGDEGQT